MLPDGTEEFHVEVLRATAQRRFGTDLTVVPSAVVDFDDEDEQTELTFVHRMRRPGASQSSPAWANKQT